MVNDSVRATDKILDWDCTLDTKNLYCMGLDVAEHQLCTAIYAIQVKRLFSYIGHDGAYHLSHA